MKNLYDEHPFMIDSGTFWRCDHGTTGFGNNLEWKGCWPCALRRPRPAFRTWMNGIRNKIADFIRP